MTSKDRYSKDKGHNYLDLTTTRKTATSHSPGAETGKTTEIKNQTYDRNTSAFSTHQFLSKHGPSCHRYGNIPSQLNWPDTLAKTRQGKERPDINCRSNAFSKYTYVVGAVSSFLLPVRLSHLHPSTSPLDWNDSKATRNNMQCKDAGTTKKRNLTFRTYDASVTTLI